MRVTLFLLLFSGLWSIDVRANPRLSRGIQLLQEGRVEEALPLLQRSVAEHPESEKAHNYYGLALAKMSALQTAIAEFRKALDINPNYPEAQYNLATALNRIGDLQGAILAFRMRLCTRRQRFSI